MATNLNVKNRGSLEQIVESMRLLAEVEVLVGFPEETAIRKTDTGETDDSGKAILGGLNPNGPTNAMLGYVHDNGSPENNIPARPFMAPGIEAARGTITRKMAIAVNGVLLRGGDATFVAQSLTQVGLTAKLSIQNTINDGIPPPLSPATLKARAKKGRKGAGIELLSRSMGYEAGMDYAKPLVDTGQMRNAVNYTIRKRKDRGK